MILKKVYYISNEILTGDRYLEKFYEYDLQGNVVEAIHYDKNGVPVNKVITERYKNNIASIRAFMKIEELKYFYNLEEYIYDGNNLLSEKIKLTRQDSDVDARQDEVEDESWFHDRKAESTYVSICKYKYDSKNRLVWENYTNYGSDNNETSLEASEVPDMITEYYYCDNDDAIMIKKYFKGDNKPNTAIIVWSNDKQHKIINEYSADGSLFGTEHTIFNPDGSKIISKETIWYVTPNRHVYLYNKNGEIIEESRFNDYQHTGTQRVNEFDLQTGTLKGYTEYSIEKGIKKLNKQIEYEYEYEYFSF